MESLDVKGHTISFVCIIKSKFDQFANTLYFANKLAAKLS